MKYHASGCSLHNVENNPFDFSNCDPEHKCVEFNERVKKFAAFYESLPEIDKQYLDKMAEHMKSSSSRLCAGCGKPGANYIADGKNWCCSCWQDR